MYESVCIELKNKQQQKAKQTNKKKQKKNQQKQQFNKKTTDICIRIVSKLSSLMPSPDETQ